MMSVVNTSSVVSKLEALREKIDYKIEELERKMSDLEDRAAEADRDFTDAEQDRYDSYEAAIAELQYEADDIDSCISTLEEYITD